MLVAEESLWYKVTKYFPVGGEQNQTVSKCRRPGRRSERRLGLGRTTRPRVPAVGP